MPRHSRLLQLCSPGGPCEHAPGALQRVCERPYVAGCDRVRKDLGWDCTGREEVVDWDEPCCVELTVLRVALQRGHAAAHPSLAKFLPPGDPVHDRASPGRLRLEVCRSDPDVIRAQSGERAEGTDLVPEGDGLNDEGEEMWVPSEPSSPAKKPANSRTVTLDLPSSSELLVTLVTGSGRLQDRLTWATPQRSSEVLGRSRLGVVRDLAPCAAYSRELVVALVLGDRVCGRAWLGVELHQVGPIATGLELWVRHRKVVTLRGHTSPVTACLVLPPAQAVTLSSAGEAFVWSPTGRRADCLGVPNKPVRACAVFPSGDRVVTVTDNEATVWTRLGRPVMKCPGARHFAIFPCGEKLLLVSSEGTGVVWAISGAQFAVLDRPTGQLVSCAVFPGGSRLLTVAVSDPSCIWDAATGARLATLEGHAAPCTTFAVAAFDDGSTGALTGSEDTTAILWSDTGRRLATFKAHSAAVTACLVLPRSGRVVTLARDGVGVLWTSAGKKLSELIRGHSAAVTSCAAFPDGARFVTASVDKTAILWTDGGLRLAVLTGHMAPVTGCAVFPGGDWVLTASEDGTGMVWPLAPFLGTLEESGPPRGDLQASIVGGDWLYKA